VWGGCENANHKAPATESFVKESWRLAGYENLWRENLPLVFDKRNRDREEALKQKYLPKRKRDFILLFTEGHSSPMQCERIVRDLVRACGLPVIENPKAERIFDLLALMEEASVIVASDSAPLQLAQAVDTPVVALITDKPSLWHGTAMRHNHFAYVRYGRIGQDGHRIASAIIERDRYKSKKFLHVYADFCRNSGDVKRWEVMNESIGAVARNNVKPFAFTDSHFAGEGVPSIKTMLRMACLQCSHDDQIIVLTNNDTCFFHGAWNTIEDAVRKRGSCYANRLDYEGEPRLIKHALGGEDYPGTDLFAFTKKWWVENQHDYPDMKVGRECWDMVFRIMLEQKGGVRLEAQIYHFRHDSHWIVERMQDEDNAANRRAARLFLAKHGMEIPKELQFAEMGDASRELNR